MRGTGRTTNAFLGRNASALKRDTRVGSKEWMVLEASAAALLLLERGFSEEEIGAMSRLCPQLSCFEEEGVKQRMNYVSYAAERNLLGDVALNEYVRDQPWVLNGNMSVVHEDEDILVIEKAFDTRVDIPRGGEYKWKGEPTVADWLADKYTDISRTNPRFVNQLDYGTSGLMVIGRTKEGANKYSKLFRERRVFKEYAALCFGHPPWNSSEITASIREGDGFKMEIASPGDKGGKPSTTRMHVIRRGILKHGPHAGDPVSLIRVLPQEGRRHQIRVHMALAGYPILGDMTYAAAMHNKKFYPYRLYLHATKLQMSTGSADIDLCAPVPFEPIECEET